MITVLGRKLTIPKSNVALAISDLPEYELITLNTFFWICSSAFLLCFRSTPLLMTKKKVPSCTIKPHPWCGVSALIHYRQNSIRMPCGGHGFTVKSVHLLVLISFAKSSEVVRLTYQVQLFYFLFFLDTKTIASRGVYSWL